VTASGRLSLYPVQLLLAMALFVPAKELLAAEGKGGEIQRSSTVIGPRNEYLADGANQLMAGRYEEGIRLTLAGLSIPNSNQDSAAGHSNLCAGYAALRDWNQALSHCNKALELDTTNWRVFNNRAAAYAGLARYDEALADIRTGLELAPHSETLKKSLKITQGLKRMNVKRKRSTTSS
jgi:tetratricopeptide (TPR) repeat protein